MALRATKFEMKVALEQPLFVMQITNEAAPQTDELYLGEQFGFAGITRAAAPPYGKGTTPTVSFPCIPFVPGHPDLYTVRSP